MKTLQRLNDWDRRFTVHFNHHFPRLGPRLELWQKWMLAHWRLCTSLLAIGIAADLVLWWLVR